MTEQGHIFCEKTRTKQKHQKQNKKGNQSSKVGLSTCLYFNFINKLVPVKRLLMIAYISDRSTHTTLYYIDDCSTAKLF